VKPENPLHAQAYEEMMKLELNSLSPMQLMLKIHDLKAKLSTPTKGNTSSTLLTNG
jgi:hypothetical protein